MGFKKKTSEESTFQAGSATIEEIEDYREKVRRDQVPCILPPCPKCQTKPGYFKRHDKRKRQFNVIIEQVVNIIFCLLLRWKCQGCGKTFTQYPQFALPYKRYTLQTIKDFCSEYVEDQTTSYRDLVSEFPVKYERNDNKEPFMDHSTIHRWISTLGGYMGIIRKAQKVYIEADPSSSIIRDIAGLTIAARKYVKDARRKLLIRCRRLLNLDRQYESILKVSIFPNLATNCYFT